MNDIIALDKSPISRQGAKNPGHCAPHSPQTDKQVPFESPSLLLVQRSNVPSMSLRQPATGNRPPAAQIAAIRLLADSLYEATCGSLALTNQARNELGLLLTVLGATETHAFSLGADLTHLPVLRKRLHGCHDVLSDLQKLHLHPDALGAQSQISDIRARLSSAVFGLSELNTNMMMCVKI